MRRQLFALGIVMLVLEGCGAPPYQPAVFATRANAPYTLASGDRLRVIVFGQDSLSNTYDVDGSGNISMPLIGLVNAKDLTINELQQAIAAKLRDGYLRDPQVSVEVQAYRPFFILGEVTTAGQYPYVNGMTVQTAVALAGGFSPRASQSGVDLTRVIRGVLVTASVPLSERVRPGDTIKVRQRFF
ncbi:MAG TPA: polysaccharide biosynthesis/export family protein [Beijerinckiaceae bacterium]|nr:polysaccharide biosynthesis/export family protein [Beijerinckiaceae bacterium]